MRIGKSAPKATIAALASATTAVLTLVPILPQSSARADYFDSLVPYFEVPLNSKANSTYEATPGALYSNVDPLSYQTVGYFSGGATTVAGNTITQILADDITTSLDVPGGAVNQITFSYFNQNTTSVSFRIRTRFYASDGPNGGPGTLINGASILEQNNAPGSGGRIYFDASSLGLNLGSGTTIWAGVAFDNDNGAFATTADQLNQLGQLVYDPPIVGTSQDLAFLSSPPTDGNFLYSSPSGNFYDSGTSAYSESFGWEFVGPDATLPPSSWNVDSNGTYTNAANWSNSVPQGALATAIFGNKIAAPRTVFMDTNQSVGTLIFSSPIAYTLSGPGNLAVGGTASGGTISVTAGSHVVSSSLSTGGATQVTIAANSQLTASNWNDSLYALTKLGTGTFAVNREQAPTLTISAGTISLIAGGTLPSQIGTMTIAGGTSAPTAAINITDNDIIFGSGTSFSNVQKYVAFARDAGKWDRGGIKTTSAPMVGSVLSVKGIGVVTGSEYLSVGSTNTTFDGVAVTASQTLVKFTYNGDADLSGKIDANDYARIDAGFQNQHNAGFTFDWFHGDFDFNHVIDANDYALIDAAYQGQNGTLREAILAMETGVAPTGPIRDSLQAVLAHAAEFGVAYTNDFIQITVPEPNSILIVTACLGAFAQVRRRRPAARS